MSSINVPRIIRWILVSIFGWLLPSPILQSQSVQIDSIELHIDQLMKDFDTPGLAIAIVHNDSIVLSKGYGVLEINKNKSVNENTIFGIGSISKSFTALTLGILVGEEKISWDDKVKSYLPYFELYHPYVTENFTIRDLLTHRSGLRDVSGGILWYHSDYSRVEIIKRLKNLEPVSGFREKPAYQNVMYVVASEIVRTVSGMSWDHFLEARVFERLNMKNSTSKSAEREANPNLAQPHIWNEKYEMEAITQEKGDNLAPGGFVYSSVNDMSSYIRLLLSDGIMGSDTLINPGIVNEIFKPQIVYPLYGPPFHNEFTSYGFGWWLTPKNGHKIIEHSGGIDGMSANLVMIKDLKFGFVILSNEAEEPSVFLLTTKILEMILDDDSYDIYSLVKDYRDKNLKAKKVDQDSKIPNTNTSLPLEKYAGNYRDKIYGDIIIGLTDTGALEISFTHTPIFTGKLEHWHYDTFKIDWYDIRIPDGLITFNFNSEREILGLSMDQENLLDVDFGELDIKKY